MLRLDRLEGPFNGLAQKIEFIFKCYLDSLTDPRLRTFVEDKAGRGNDRLTRAANLFLALCRNLQYTDDHVGVEYIKTPTKMLDSILMRGYVQGDCDDQACFNYAALMTLGIPALIRVAWYDGRETPEHIYAVALIGNREYPFDTARLKPIFGQEAPYSHKEDFCDEEEPPEAPPPKLSAPARPIPKPPSYIGRLLGQSLKQTLTPPPPAPAAEGPQAPVEVPTPEGVEEIDSQVFDFVNSWGWGRFKSTGSWQEPEPDFQLLRYLKDDEKATFASALTIWREANSIEVEGMRTTSTGWVSTGTLEKKASMPGAWVLENAIPLQYGKHGYLDCSYLFGVMVPFSVSYKEVYNSLNDTDKDRLNEYMENMKFLLQTRACKDPMIIASAKAAADVKARAVEAEYREPEMPSAALPEGITREGESYRYMLPGESYGQYWGADDAGQEAMQIVPQKDRDEFLEWTKEQIRVYGASLEECEDTAGAWVKLRVDMFYSPESTAKREAIAARWRARAIEAKRIRERINIEYRITNAESKLNQALAAIAPYTAMLDRVSQGKEQLRVGAAMGFLGGTSAAMRLVSDDLTRAWNEWYSSQGPSIAYWWNVPQDLAIRILQAKVKDSSENVDFYRLEISNAQADLARFDNVLSSGNLAGINILHWLKGAVAIPISRVAYQISDAIKNLHIERILGPILKAIRYYYALYFDVMTGGFASGLRNKLFGMTEGEIKVFDIEAKVTRNATIAVASAVGGVAIGASLGVGQFSLAQIISTRAGGMWLLKVASGAFVASITKDAKGIISAQFYHKDQLPQTYAALPNNKAVPYSGGSDSNSMAPIPASPPDPEVSPPPAQLVQWVADVQAGKTPPMPDIPNASQGQILDWVNEIKAKLPAPGVAPIVTPTETVITPVTSAAPALIPAVAGAGAGGGISAILLPAIPILISSILGRNK